MSFRNEQSTNSQEASGRERTASFDRSQTLAVGVIVVAFISTAWIQSRGWFYSDDFYNLTEAQRRAFGWDYLTRDLFGHVVPGFMAQVWLVANPGGARYDVAMASMLATYLAMIVLSRVVATKLGAPKTVAWWAAALTALNVALVPSLTWWAASLNYLSSAVFGLLFVWGHLCWLDKRKSRYLLGATVSFWLAMSMSEGAVVVLIAAVGISAWQYCEGDFRDRALALVKMWPAWLAYGLAVLAVGALVLGQSEGFGADPPDPANLLMFPCVLLAQGYLPSLVGLSLGSIESNVAAMIGLVCLLGAALGIRLWIRRTGPRCWWPIAIVVCTLVVRSLFVAWARFDPLGFFAARDQRYFSDLVWLGPVLIAGAWNYLPAPAPQTKRITRFEPAVLALGIAVVTGLIGQAAEAPNMGPMGAKTYRDRFMGSYRMAIAEEPDATMLDIAAGEDLAPALLARYSLLSRTITFGVDGLEFNNSDGPLLGVDPSGLVGPVKLEPRAVLDLSTLDPNAVTLESVVNVDTAGTATGGACWTAGESTASVVLVFEEPLAKDTYVLDLVGVQASTSWSERPPMIYAYGESTSDRSRLDFVVHSKPAGHGRDRDLRGSHDRVLLTPTPFGASGLIFEISPRQELCLASLTLSQIVAR